MSAVPDPVRVAEAIVREAAREVPCEACGWLLWEHAQRPEHCGVSR